MIAEFTSDGWSGIIDVQPGDTFHPVTAADASGTSIASSSFWWVEEYPASGDLPVVLIAGAGAPTLTGPAPAVTGARIIVNPADAAITLIGHALFVPGNVNASRVTIFH